MPRGTFCLFPSRASRGDRPPPETEAPASTGGGGGGGGRRRLPQRSPRVRHPHLTPLPETPGRGATGTSHPPATHPPLSTSPRGLSPPRPHQPPAQARVSGTLRPLSAPGRRVRGESPAPPPAANSPASAGAAS